MKRVLKECVTCLKAEGKPFKSPPMAALPDFRVRQVGIDCTGPLFIKFKTAEMVKSYLALFSPFGCSCRLCNYIFMLLTKVRRKEGHSFLNYIRQCKDFQGICESDNEIV